MAAKLEKNHNELFDTALAEYNAALNNYNNAEPEFIDVAIHELKAKEEKLNLILKILKRG